MIGLTREYVGGLLAGAGAGILIYSYFVLGREEMFRNEWYIAAFILIAVGSSLARYAQRNAQHDKHHDS